MQGERGSLRDLQRYHRGGDGTRRRITIGNKKDQIIEEYEVDGNRISASNAEQDSISVQKIPKTNLGCKSPKSVPRGKRSDHDNLIKEEAPPSTDDERVSHLEKEDLTPLPEIPKAIEEKKSVEYERAATLMKM